MINQYLPYIFEYGALLGGIYMMLLASIMSTKDIVSGVYLRFLPMMSGLLVILHVIGQ